ncbi:hypothetical protein CCR91_08690 [Thiorhodovibrio winogradskyi]|nr:hypothetical protein [Thiorhodovibrio winogradskyi]
MIETPLGELGVCWQEGEERYLVAGVRLPVDQGALPGEGVPAPAWLEREFRAYFCDPAHAFGIALRLAGTAFQQRVWRALQGIPPGSVRRYGELATELGSSARAVGNACRANPCPIIVPCHRVVASRGLGGFAGKTLGASMNVKAWLLRYEGVDLTELGA